MTRIRETIDSQREEEQEECKQGENEECKQGTTFDGQKLSRPGEVDIYV